MKLSNANAVRAQFVAKLMEYLSDEDCAQIASNSFNFPISTPDGDSGFVEIVVKIPKDDDADCYAKRDEYTINLAKKEAKAKAAAEAKAKKIAKAKAEKEAKAKAKAKAKAEQA